MSLSPQISVYTENKTRVSTTRVSNCSLKWAEGHVVMCRNVKIWSFLAPVSWFGSLRGCHPIHCEVWAYSTNSHHKYYKSIYSESAKQPVIYICIFSDGDANGDDDVCVCLMQSALKLKCFSHICLSSDHSWWLTKLTLSHTNREKQRGIPLPYLQAWK